MKNTYISAEMSILKIVSVLMIVFGSLGILLYALGLAAVVGLTLSTSGVFSASRDLLSMALLLLGALVELVTGILGSKAARRPARAGKALIVWGILTLLLTLAGMVLVVLRSSRPWWEYALGLTLSVVTPMVYLVFAARIRNSIPHAEAQAEAEPAPEA